MKYEGRRMKKRLSQRLGDKEGEQGCVENLKLNS
jgi:hypothetical protein